MTISFELRRPFGLIVGSAFVLGGCQAPPAADRVRVSGHIEATEVRIAPLVAGRIVRLEVSEGDRVSPGATIALLDTADAEIALARGRAEVDQASAQLRLLEAGSRVEDIRLAEANVAVAEAEAAALEAEVVAAQADADRFEALLASDSGSRKQRDDAVARYQVVQARAQAARNRTLAARETLSRLSAGARTEEIDAARARVQVAEAQVATWQKAVSDATVTAAVSGVVTDTILDVGEIAQPRVPIVVVTDLDEVWANVYLDEPDVPRIRIGQEATLYTDAGNDPVSGVVSYISSRAEFTPRNVQTAEDRSRLVYLVKISATNPNGILKVGMPIEAEILFVN
jgi:HlyD family secretion protein